MARRRKERAERTVVMIQSNGSENPKEIVKGKYLGEFTAIEDEREKIQKLLSQVPEGQKLVIDVLPKTTYDRLTNPNLTRERKHTEAPKIKQILVTV